jgi:hypothetical protein
MEQFYQKDDVNKRPITIVDNKELFYMLSDGQMIKKDVFPKYYYPIMNESVTPKISNTDYVDPNSFFNTPHAIPVEKLKKVDTSRMKDDEIGAQVIKNTTNQMKSIPNTPNVPRQNINENLVQQTPINQPIPNHTNTDVSQYKVFDNDDDAYNDFIKKSQQGEQPQQPAQVQSIKPVMSEIEVLFEDEKITFGLEEAIKRRDTRLKRTHVESNTNISQPQLQIDPSEIMFKTFKRNHDISINVTFKDKIGKPDFVKMMIENMEGDIIQFYKKIIMNNIINNLKFIEDEVEKNLKLEIFGDKNNMTTETELKKTKSKPKKEKIEKINDISNKPLLYINAEEEKLIKSKSKTKKNLKNNNEKINLLPDENFIKLGTKYTKQEKNES